MKYSKEQLRFCKIDGNFVYKVYGNPCVESPDVQSRKRGIVDLEYLDDRGKYRKVLMEFEKEEEFSDFIKFPSTVERSYYMGFKDIYKEMLNRGIREVDIHGDEVTIEGNLGEVTKFNYMRDSVGQWLFNFVDKIVVLVLERCKYTSRFTIVCFPNRVMFDTVSIVDDEVENGCCKVELF